MWISLIERLFMVKKNSCVQPFLTENEPVYVFEQKHSWCKICYIDRITQIDYNFYCQGYIKKHKKKYCNYNQP